MDPCKSTLCIFFELKQVGSSPNTLLPTPFTGSTIPEDTTTSYNVLLPVLLIIGVLIALGVGLIFHRLIMKFIRKLWGSGESSNGHVSSRGTEGDYSPRRRGLRTISGNFRDLPSYAQVMATIEAGEMPPSYYDISGGRINVAYNSDGILPRFVDLQFENEANPSQVSTNSEVGAGRVSQELTVPPVTNSESEPNQIPLIDEDLKKKVDIDELINSISVPSLLTDIEVGALNEAAKVESKKTNGTKTGNKKQAPKSVLKLPPNRFHRRAIILTSTPF